MNSLRVPSRILTVAIVCSVAFVLAMLPMVAGGAQPAKPVPDTKVTTSTDAALAKLHPKLKAKLGIQPGATRGLAAVGLETTATVEILARVDAGTDVGKYMTWSLTRPFVDPFGRQAVLGEIKVGNLLKLASLSEVSAIQPLESVVEPPEPPDPDLSGDRADIQRRKDAFKAALAASGGPQPTGGWFDVDQVHKSKAAWDKGFTGEGVKVMNNDSGSDFAHPDLQGTWAVVTEEDSPYFGWPEMFDSWSMYLYARDNALGESNIANGLADYADTSTVCEPDEDAALGAVLTVDNTMDPVAGMARVRVAHASPDAPAVDILVDGGEAFGDVAFKDVTDYAGLEPGTYNVQVVPAGGSPNQAVISETLTLDADTDYTVAAVGRVANIEPLALVDDNSAPAAGKAHVRFVHASPNAPAVDIAVAGGPVLLSDIAFKEFTSYLPVDAGTYDLEVRLAGTDTVVLSLPGVTVEDGNVYTAFAMGLVGETCVYAPIGAAGEHIYVLPGTGVSGEYHVGSHPDKALADMVNGDWDAQAEGEERVAILVVDENEANVYDTVYVDLNANFDFTDDKPVTKDDPISYADVWDAFAENDDGTMGAPGSDGYADISGGLVYFIADGENPIPASDWLWQDLAPAPDNGNLVAFTVQDYTEGGGNHGQGTGSSIVSQGIVDGVSALGYYPNTKAPGDGTPGTGVAVAPGKDVKMTINGNFYISPFIEDGWLFSALGYDGQPGTQDDVQIITNSWGFSGTDNDGWDEDSRLIDGIVRRFNPALSTLHSTGNGAAGYGTVAPPSPPIGVSVGASTQYGSIGLFESISDTDQINWGDVISWSNRGPGARGDNGVDVTATGAFGIGLLSLNQVGDGWSAWSNFGGTSEASPIAAGNLALVYQAYKETHGTWPSAATARAILKAGADNQHYDTFVQGAGTVNADRATDIAAGLEGVYTMPDNWAAGDYRGTEYPGFANIIHPGEVSTKTFTVNNLATSAAEVTLSVDNLVKTGDYTIDFTSEDQSLEDGSFTKPDYVFRVDDQIPEGTDLMEVKVVYPWAEWDPDDTYEIQQLWRVHVQDWKDLNGDGDLWEDLNGDGVVNSDEIDPNEHIRFTYGYNAGNALQARVQRPLERMHDGIFISLRHRNRTEDIPVTNMQIEVNFYQHSEFDWLSLSTDSLTVPAEGTAAFEAMVDVPEDTALGIYNAAIVIGQPDGAESVVPVTVNVAANSADFTFGGTEPADTPYDNGRVFGYFDWTWRAESGDWRFFATDLPDDVPDNTLLLVDTQWENAETDIDTLVMGPTEDDFSNDPEDSFYDPDYYGPYTLDTLDGGSANNYLGSGVWRRQTNTGGPREMVAVEAQPGLHVIALHNVLYAGADTSESFTGAVGTLQVTPRPISITTDTDAGSVEVTVESSLALEDLAAEGWGLGLPETYTDQVVEQDDPNDPTTASYTRTVAVEHAAVLEVSTGNSSGNDLDLYVYDPDGDLRGSSTTPDDTEQVGVQFPEDGEWTIAVHGWSVPGDTAIFDLTVNAVQGFDLTVTDVPAGPFESNEEITFTLNYDREMEPDETWQGLVTLGPSIAPGVVKVPVIINRVPPPPPEGRYSLTVRTYLDYRCDDFFVGGVDRALPDVPVTVTFDNGAEVTETTSAAGLVLFNGYDMADPLTVSVEMPEEYRGRALEACANSPASVDLTGGDFNLRYNFVSFRAQVKGETAEP